MKFEALEKVGWIQLMNIREREEISFIVNIDYCEKIVAVLFNFVLFDHVELAEEVKGNDGVQVNNNGHEHECEHELCAGKTRRFKV